MFHSVRPIAIILIAGVLRAAAVAACQQDDIDGLIARATELASPQVRRADLAVPLLQHALSLAEAAADPERGALAAARLGAAYRSTHRTDAALAVLERGTVLGREAGRPDLEGLCTRTIGNIHIEGGRYELARGYLERALSIADSSGDVPLRIAVLNALSVSARLQGRLSDALQHARDALALVDAESAAGRRIDAQPLFSVPFNVGKALADGGDYGAALAYFERAFAAAEANHMIAGIWHALFDTAEWYQGQGDLDRAASYYRRALDQARKSESHDMEGHTIRGLASIAEARGELTDAADQYATALRFYETYGLGAWIPSTMAALARTNLKMGRLDEAEALLARASTKARLERRPLDLARVLIEAASVARARGDFATAARDYDEARAIAADTGLRPTEAIAAAGLARVTRDRGDSDEALALYRKAESTIAHLRARIPAPDQRATFSDAVHATFAGEFDLLMELARRHPDGAYTRLGFLTLERERAQDLAGTLVDGRIEATHSLPPDLEARRARVSRRLAEIQTELMAPDIPADRRRALRAEQDDRERDWDAVLASPMADGASAIAGSEASTEVIARLQQALAPGEAFIAYAPRHAFVVTRQTFRHVDLPVVDQLAERVDFFVRLLSGDDPVHAPVPGRVLSRTFIGPVQAVLPQGTTRLLIAATGALAGLPFAALPDPDQRRPAPLLSRYEIGYVMSATGLVRLRESQPGRRSEGLLAIANPSRPAPAPPQLFSANFARADALGVLPYAQQEVEGAAEYAGGRSRILMGAAATEYDFTHLPLGDFSVLHFATHAVLDSDAPMRSAIVLAGGRGDDGLLQAREIFQLPLNADLVVLSACRTAAGRASTAQGMQSLARAFVHAGAHSVLGTLWDVDDRETALLIDRFYEAAAQGVPAVAALRRAQLALIGTDPYASAPRWAGFVITGDGATRVSTLRPARRYTRAMVLLLGALASALLATTIALRRSRRSPFATA